MTNKPVCLMCGFDGATDAVLIEDGEPYDLRTLERVHNVWEFLARSERQFDVWLHAQIIRAEKEER